MNGDLSALIAADSSCPAPPAACKGRKQNGNQLDSGSMAYYADIQLPVTSIRSGGKMETSPF